MSIVFKRKKHVKKRIFIVLACFLCILVAVWLFLEKVVNPVIFSVSEAQVRAMATESVNMAVSNAMRGNVSYADLIQVTKNEKGDIKLLQTNTAKMSALARSAVLAAQNGINNVAYKGLAIPIGTISGIPILSGTGYVVKFRLLPIGAVQCRFVSDFKQAGINQTLHRVSVEVTALVDIVLPGKTQRVEASTDLVIVECVLIGDIPQTYLNANSLDEAFNLVPDVS